MMHVVAVHAAQAHSFSGETVGEINLIPGFGVSGDAHCGQKVQHRSRVARDPSQLNLRQVHLLQQELLDELAERGFAVGPGALGENVTTCGLDLHAAVLDRNPDGSLLRKGASWPSFCKGGAVKPGDSVAVAVEPGEHVGLQPD